MKAMILAAGLGTRLRPLTNMIPKPLLPIAGTPLIVWNLLLLKRHGFHDVVINLHHLGPMIEQALGNGSRYGLRIVYSREPVILGTGGGLKQEGEAGAADLPGGQIGVGRWLRHRDILTYGCKRPGGEAVVFLAFLLFLRGWSGGRGIGQLRP